MNLKDTVAIVTGGASGLGQATVRRIVQEGGRVGILDRENSDGAKLAEELGDAARFVPADVTDPAAVEKAVDAVVEAFGKLTAAVNCAGVGMAGRVLSRDGAPHDFNVFTTVIQINLIGTFNVLRIAASRMARNEPDANGERGVVVNTASIAAYDGQIGQVAYAASKGGVVSMTLPIARDLAKWGIRCCTVAPGTFSTPMMAMVTDEFKKELEGNIPFPSRMGDPAEFGHLVSHIIANPYINGETIRIDGALRMPPK